MTFTRTKERTPLNSNVKLIVRVLQDVTARDSFQCYADLTEELKCRLAKLKIPYRDDWIGDAIARLGKGGQCPLIPRVPSERQRLVERPPEPEIISRGEAERLYNRLMSRVKRDGLKAMPTPRKPVSVRTNDRAKATRMIWQAILDQIQVCEAVERRPE